MCRPRVEFLPNLKGKSDQEGEVTLQTKKTDCGIFPYAREVVIKYFDHTWPPLPILDLESRVGYVQHHSEKAQRSVESKGSPSVNQTYALKPITVPGFPIFR